MFDSYFDDTAEYNIVDFSIQKKVLLCCVRDHCPAMDMKKLKKLVNLKNCEFQKDNRDPEKSN